MFIVALLTKGKIWKPPKCPLIDESIKKKWNAHTHTQWNITLPYKEWNCAIYDSMDSPRRYYAKRRMSDKDKYYIIYFIFRIKTILEQTK